MSDDIATDSEELDVASDSSSDLDTSQPQPTDDGAAPTELTGEGTSQAGPIPLERHQAVLENARAETARLQSEYEAYKQRVSWAEKLDQRAVHENNQLIDWINGDPVSALKTLQQKIAAHPVYGPKYRVDPEEKLPEPTLQSEDGKFVYTTDQLNQVLAINQRRAAAEAAEQMGELRRELQALKEHTVQRVQQERAAQTSSAMLAELNQLPGWNAVKDAVARDFAMAPQEEADKYGNMAFLYRLYLKHHTGQSESKATQSAVDRMKRKANASSVSPGSSPAASHNERPMTEKDLAQLMERLSQEGA